MKIRGKNLKGFFTGEPMVLVFLFILAIAIIMAVLVVFLPAVTSGTSETYFNLWDLVPGISK